MEFEEAIGHAKAGKTIRNRLWNAPHTVRAQYPDKGSANTEPYFYMITARGQRIPWIPSFLDMFSEDWCVLTLPEHAPNG